MKSLSIFCGSRLGKNPVYTKEAKTVAKALAESNIDLVYGGANVGLMGILADELLALGGKAIGVMPKNLIERERAHQGLTQLHTVNTMHERKALMHELSDGAILMPGGAGSLDEFFEVFTWSQLGYHNKPVAILNTNNYFSHLIRFIEHGVSSGFISETEHSNILVSDCPFTLIHSMKE